MVVMKSILPAIAPLFMAAVRLLPAGLLVLWAGKLQGRSHPNSGEAWFWILLFALVDGTFFQGLLAEGLQRIDAGLGSLLIDSQPLAVALLATWLFGERLTLWGIGGLAIGLVGITLIGLPADWLEQLRAGTLTGFSLGEWLMLGSALSMAVGTILIRPVTRYADPVMATGWHMVLGSLPLIVLSWRTESIDWQGFTLITWLGLVYMSVMGSAIAYGLFFYFASTGNLTTLSALTFSTPVFAILFGRIFLGEQLTSVQWLGVTLTLCSIYLVNTRGLSAQMSMASPKE